MRQFAIAAATALGLLTAAGAAQAQDALRPDQVAFRALFEELVEIDTTLSNGSCTLAAERMAAHLKAAGFTDDQLTLFSVPEAPRDGGLVAVLPGSGEGGGPILLLGHLDVVEARREDWTRDPFTLVEEDGWFYARGVSDMKDLDSVWVDMLARFRREGFKPRRTLKLALTCGEESDAFNGAKWLVANRPELIAADFVLNEGGGGVLGEDRQVVSQLIQVGEKVYQDYRLEAVNPGGHSSIPIRDNAIYQLSEALLKVRDHVFPAELTDTTRTFLARQGALQDDAIGAAMRAVAADPTDAAALAVLAEDRTLNSVLRTTCVGTMLSGGHANNALPQRASAVVNCRIFPGHDAAETRDALIAAIGDPGVAVTYIDPVGQRAVVPPLRPELMGPIEALTERYFPGVPVIPSMSTGATDAVHFASAGIPVYGVPGIWYDNDGNGAHGLNERLEVKALYTGRDFLTDLVRTLIE